jgi:TonB family protein
VGDSDRSNRQGLYLQKMNRKIRSNLEAPGVLAFPTRTMLVLEIDPNGRVTKIILTDSSGNPTLDRKAIQAVEKSSPFDPWGSELRIQVPVVFNVR